jgi:hypothetical protein
MGMDEDKGQETPINFTRENIKDSEWKVDPAVYTAARIFNAVALPDDMPDFIKEAIEAKAEQARISAQEAGFVAPDTNRLIDGKTLQERERDKDEETRLYVASIIEEDRRERERVWDNSQVKIGTVAMSGEEWDGALELLSDPRLRDQLIQTMTRKKGWTQDRAEKAADDALILARLAQKEKDGTMTAADRAQADDITRRNPDAAVMVKEAARVNQERGMSTEADYSASAQSALSSDIASVARSRQNAVKDMATDKTFASAPTLASHFDEARNAIPVSRMDEPAIKPLPSQQITKPDMNTPF